MDLHARQIVNVLLIEDDPQVSVFIQDLIPLIRSRSSQIAGYTARQVSTLAQAQRYLEKGMVDIVLLDLNLPDSQGIASIDKVRHWSPTVPIVVVSPQVDESLAIQALEAGAQDFLIKDHLNFHALGYAMRYAMERQRWVIRVSESEARLHKIIQNYPDGILVTNLKGDCLFVNPAAQQLFGRSLEEMLATSFPFAVAGTSLEAIDIARPDKDKAVVEISLLETDWAGEAAYLVALRDVTARKRAEKALEESEEHLRQSLRLETLGRLTGGLVHDFNNMLTAVTVYSDFLLRKMDPADPNRADIQEIRRAGQRAVAIAKQMLMLSSRQNPKPESLDPNALLGEMGKMLARLLGESILLDWNLGQRGDLVLIDAVQFEQVILNLAVNARDAMPAGGTLSIVSTRVEITDDLPHEAGKAFAAGAYMKISLSDTGTGMDEGTRKQIFEPFFTTKERGKGTGLGLASADGIIRAAGGRMDVSSKPGVGTTFAIFLPITLDKAAVKAAPQDLAQPRQGTETILLVEDEEIVRGLIPQVLEKYGYRVLVAQSSDEAQLICKHHEGPIHLILTDVVMPKMNGRELVQVLSPTRDNLRVVYMSGYMDDIIAQHGGISKGSMFIQKPFSPDDLAGKVRQALDELPRPAPLES